MIGSMLLSLEMTKNPSATGFESGRNATKNGQIKVSPNPFNQTTMVSFTAENAGSAEIFVYNINGELIKNLNPLPSHKDNKATIPLSFGREASSGIYIVKVQIGNRILQKRISLIK